MEHRRGQRKTVSLAVRIDARRFAPLVGEIVDMSVGGAFIRLKDFIPPPNTIIRLSFDIPGIEQTEHECRALIVRKEQSGIGVMFDRRQDFQFLLRAAACAETLPALKTSVSARRPAGAPAGGVMAAATVD